MLLPCRRSSKGATFSSIAPSQSRFVSQYWRLLGAVNLGFIACHVYGVSLTHCTVLGSCGLFVVSTQVGGVPEVLPPQMIRFADPGESDPRLRFISLRNQECIR